MIRVEYDYLIQVPLPGGAGMFTVCVCDSPESTGAVVTALCAAATEPAALVQVTPRVRLDRRT